MNKRITSALLAFVLVLCMLVSAVPAFATAATVFKITPDKTTANPGDTINYTVTMGAITDLAGMKLKLVIPEGLTFVTGAAAPNIQTTLKAASAEWTESTKVFLVGSSDWTSSDDLTLFTFSCTVNAGANGNYAVLFDDATFEVIDSEDNDISCDRSNLGSTVTVTPAPVAVTGVTVSPKTKELTAAGQTFSVLATVAPTDAANKTVSFTSGSPAVATVDAATGVVTAVANGTAVITAKTADGNKTDTCTVTVNIPHVHTWQEIPAVASTCSVQGNNHYWKCTDCGKYYKDDKTTETTPEAEKLPLAAHTLTHHPAVAATHTAAGSIEYWYCSICDKFFSDAACTHEITAADTVVAKIPHSYSTEWSKDAANHWHECSCGSKADVAAHTFKWIVDVAATEDSTGLEHEVCTVCGYVRNENSVIPELGHVHVWQEIPAVASTCAVQGNNHYWKCTDCGKYYKDDKTTETTPEAEKLPLAAHTLTHHPAVAATHTAAGSIEYWYCSVCDKFFSDAACTHEITAADTVVAKIPHSYSTEWSKDASEHWHECSCGSKADAAAHTYGDWTVTKEATETEAGSRQHTCSVCGYVETAEIPALGHTHVAGSEWKSDASDHWNECSCGEKMNVAAHTYGDWTVTKEATATEAGSKERVCSVCGSKEVVEIPATGTKDAAPQTGDRSHTALWTALLFVSAAGVSGTALYAKKKKDRAE